MGEYTDQEIEMLARFWCASLGGIEQDSDSSKRTAKEVRLILDGAPAHVSSGLILRSAARLMREAQSHVTIDVKKDGEIRMTTGALAVLLREAREQGAAEMRERAAIIAEDADISIPMRATIAGHIRSLAVTKAEEQ